uniref:Glucosidase II subunit alpha n=1 Tax=Pholiota microspora TaxID=1538424 RepID=A0A1J1DXZ6_PHOMI|nr:alpha-glucosidase [Pholiota microspora]
MRSLSLLGALTLLLANEAWAFKAHDFKTCDQAGFCKRGRALSARAKEAQSSWVSPYSVEKSSINISTNQAVFTADVKSSLYPEIKFGLEVRVQEDGVARVRMDEVGGLRKRYDEAASWALIEEPKISNSIKWTTGKKDIRAVYGEKKDTEVVVAFEPLRISLLRNGKEQIVLNGQGLLHMEHFRTKESAATSTDAAAPEGVEPPEGEDAQVAIKVPENPRAWFEGAEPDALWEETFLSWTDSKPKGPESLSLDINFPNHGSVYGIPQHATRLALPSTTGNEPTFTDPYRLYNGDVFEYLASSTTSLYGSIPLMHAHSADSTVAVFHVVGSETWIDVSHASDKSTETHWISESGILDTFLLPGPTAEDVFKQYARLTGTPVLPAQWSLGYHQCRWNYVSSDDVRTVQKRFDEEDMPVDVFWLDIEYSEDHKYFMWKDKTFPDPVEMTNDVAVNGRKPSVFNGPEITMPKDNIHYGGWEHRDIHNINGMLFSNLTYQAVAERTDPPMRPFVLTRSFFAGSQRFGAMWTGDNLGTWEHMAVGLKMVLSNGLGGLSFAGSDVGGFFGNPEPEMLVRWYQVGAFAPFFRAHAHIDTKRREPFLLDEPYKGIVKDILRLRYTLLPMWYTQFRETTVTGMPILRPQFIMFPKDKAGFDMDDQYYIGSSGLLVKPVTEKDAREAKVYFAEDQVYYDYFTNYVYRGSAKGKEITVAAALDQLPLFLRGGSILATRERPRRSSSLMKRDPFTLRVALSKAGNARGELYLDDGVTYDHLKGHFIWREFVAEKSGKKGLRITSVDLGAAKPGEAVDGVELATYNPANEFAQSIADVRVEKVIVIGLTTKPTSVKVEGGGELVWEYTPGVASSDKKEGQASILSIKDPRVLIQKDWAIVIQ